MADTNQANLQGVDWSKLPSPDDDGGAAHLLETSMPAVTLPSTSGAEVNLSSVRGVVVIFAYPMTGRPDIALPDGWDMIPGARGCTPQACAFRDIFAQLQQSGADHVLGLSVQSTAYQIEASQRLHLPFPLLSDASYELQKALNLPTMVVETMTLLKRLTLICVDGKIVKTFYPVFPPDRSADDVLDWLRARNA